MYGAWGVQVGLTVWRRRRGVVEADRQRALVRSVIGWPGREWSSCMLLLWRLVVVVVVEEGVVANSEVALRDDGARALRKLRGREAREDLGPAVASRRI